MKLLRMAKKKILKTLVRFTPGFDLRALLLRWCGYELGEDVYIAENFFISDRLEDTKNVIIGDRVSISYGVVLVTASDPNYSKLIEITGIKNEKITHYSL